MGSQQAQVRICRLRSGQPAAQEGLPESGECCRGLLPNRQQKQRAQQKHAMPRLGHTGAMQAGCLLAGLIRAVWAETGCLMRPLCWLGSSLAPGLQDLPQLDQAVLAGGL